MLSTIKQLSTEEVTDIQDRIMAAGNAVGAEKSPIKVQGKEYQLDHVGIDTLVAKSGVSTYVPVGNDNPF